MDNSESIRSDSAGHTDFEVDFWQQTFKTAFSTLIMNNHPTQSAAQQAADAADTAVTALRGFFLDEEDDDEWPGDEGSALPA